MQSKKCSKCWINKNLHEFTKDIQKSSWLRSSCKLCNKKWLSATEKSDIKIKKIESKWLQSCSKCKKDLSLDNFRKDSTKRTWYFSSCNDCRRDKYWIKKIENYWMNSFYSGYRKYILERDWNKCVISWVSENLHVHHIKTRGSWWSNEYNNLITLSVEVHREKAHWKELWKYRDIFLEYTSKFERPEFWDSIMEKSKQNEESIKKSRNKRNRDYARRKRKKYVESFKDSHWGLTPWQYEYRKQKEYIKNNL